MNTQLFAFIFFLFCCQLTGAAQQNDLNTSVLDTLSQQKDGIAVRNISSNKRLASHYQFNTYSVSDGLSQSQVYAAIQDNKGNVLLGTQGGGISVFDGKDFSVLSTANGLLSNYIHCFFKTNDGAILIGTSEGLNVLKNNKIQAIGSPFEKETIVAIQALSDKNVLVLGQKHVFQFLHDSLVFLEEIQKHLKGSLTSAAVGLNNRLFIGGAQGLFEFENFVFRNHYTAQNGLNNTAVQALACDKNNQLWIGTYGDGINCFSNDSLVDANQFLPASRSKILALYCDDKNDLWVGMLNGGAFKFSIKDSSILVLNESCGLANNHVRCMVQDDWQHMWIGTSGGGVSKYAPNTFDFFDQKSGLAGNYIYAISKDTSAAIWVSTSGEQGIAKYENERFLPQESFEALVGKKVKAMLHSKDGRIWFGTESDGLFVYDGADYKQFTSKQGLQSNYVRKLVEDAEGTVWLATVGGGIGYILPQKSIEKLHLTMLEKNDGLITKRINDIVVAKEGAVWFASATSGIGKIENYKVIKTIDESNGLISNRVNALCADSLGQIWIGTAGNGLMCYNGGAKDSLTHYTTKSGLHSNICYSLLLDKNGVLWLGSEKGVEQIQLDASGNILSTHNYGFEEGFLGVETTLHAALSAPDGTNWFGTIKGLAKYNANAQHTENTLPILSISSITVNQLEMPDFTGNLSPRVLPFDSNSIGIKFLAISQLRPKAVVYKWRLIGLDTTWTVQKTEGNLSFSNLPSGNYRFEVQASTDGVLWTIPQSIVFFIAKPYWETWWFRALLLLVILLSGYGVSQWRIKRIKAKSKEKEKQWQLEKEVLELEQKALRLQMNPHFIFNALNSIQAMISENDTKTARYYLVKFSKLMRQVLESSQKQKISLENELVTLQNYLAIEQFCHNNRFDYELVVEENIHTDEIEIPPIVLQPFIENAIIHGLATKPEQGLLRIAFSIEKNTLLCTITDNGIGRKAAEKSLHQRDAKHKSTALVITQERLDNLNQNKTAPSIEIIDLYQADGQPKGTEVRVRIDL